MHASLKTLVYFEFRSYLRSFRFLVSTGLLTVLIGFVVWLGHVNYQINLEVHTQSLERHSEGLRQTSLYSYVTPTLFKPPNPLAVFEQGVEEREGRQVEISAFEIPSKATAQNRGNPYLGDLAGLDVTTVVKLVLGLGALLLTFDSMVGERSRRQIEALIAQGLAIQSILWAKVLAVVGALSVGLIVALGPPVGLMVYWGELSLTLQMAGRLLGLSMVYGAYGLTMALLGFWISLKTNSVARSLVYATSAWFVLIVLLPLTSSALVTAYADIHLDPLRLKRQIVEADQQRERLFEEFRRLDPLRIQTTGHYGFSRLWEKHSITQRLGSAEFNDSMAEAFAYNVALGKRFAARKYWLRSKAQSDEDSLVRPLTWLATLSPGPMLDLAAANLAATSATDHELFMEFARQYRTDFIAFLEQRGAIGSWRWFTDDPPTGLPWVSFLGLEPDEVGIEDFHEYIKLYLAPEVQDEVKRELESRQGPAYWLDLAGLPSTEVPSAAGAVRAVVSVVASLLLVAIFWMLVLDATGETAQFIGSGREVKRSPAALRRRWPGLWGEPTWLKSELQHVTSQFRWQAYAFLVMLTMILGAVTFVARSHVLMDDRASEQAAAGVGSEEKSLSRFSEDSYTVSRPSWKLGFITDTKERLQPSKYQIKLNSWSFSRLENSALDQLRLASVSMPDWGFVLRIILSLFACFLGYDVFCGPQLERCRWQVASGQPLYSVVLSRVVAQWTALAAPFLLASGLSLILLHSTKGMRLSLSEWGQVLGFAAIGMVAILLFAVSALMVSALLGRSNQALVTLVLLWISFVAVIPSAAGILAFRLQPVPTYWELQASQAEVRDQTENSKGTGFRAPRVAVLDDFAMERSRYPAQISRWAEETRLQREYETLQLAQAERAEVLSSISPVGLIRSVLDRVLVSGIYRQRAFVEQTREFEQELRAWARRVDDLDPESPGFYFFPRFLSRQPIDPAEIPRFEFREPTLWEGLRSAAWPLIIFLWLTGALTTLLPWIFQYRLVSEKG